jgi:hypothetical protein
LVSLLGAGGIMEIVFVLAAGPPQEIKRMGVVNAKAAFRNFIRIAFCAHSLHR